MTQWHRWFGLLLTDLFAGSAFEVELEADLSLKQQFLDVLILRKKEGTLPESLPDGLNDLPTHTLMTYKSHQESLNAWAINELIGHYVNYRKQEALPSKILLPESEFQLVAVSTRSPTKLHQQFQLEPVQAGVWNLAWGGKSIRILVLSEIPEGDSNAVWEIFSHSQTRVQRGLSHYRWHLEQSRGLIQQLTEHYDLKGGFMSYTMNDFVKEYVQEHLHVLSAEDLLKNISSEERLRNLSSEERLRNLSAEERLKDLSLKERIQDFSTEELLQNLSSDEIRDYLKHCEPQGSS